MTLRVLNLQRAPGIIETGLHLDVVHAAYLGMPDGSVCVLRPPNRSPVARPSVDTD